MIKEQKGYSYNDLTILPEIISDVKSRSECDVFDIHNMLPIFASPMTSTVNTQNIDKYKENNIYAILPRSISIKDRIKYMFNGEWVALSLKEFESFFINDIRTQFINSNKKFKVCVDIANGHMKSLYEACKEAKELSISYGYKLIIMTGNIANPETYKWIAEFNIFDIDIRIIDYIRIGIGGGSGCLTTSNVSIHYPQATLIDECYKIKKQYNNWNREFRCPKIIADGGIRNYDHVIKALALGADYVMIGGLFAQMFESAGDKYKIDYYVINNEKNKSYIKIDTSLYSDISFEKDNIIMAKNNITNEYETFTLEVKFFGMASSDGQMSISGKKTKTAEGLTKYLPVKYTLNRWTKNMISYLQSAMSYCNSFNIEDFIGKPNLIINSISEIHAVNK